MAFSGLPLYIVIDKERNHQSVDCDQPRTGVRVIVR